VEWKGHGGNVNQRVTAVDLFVSMCLSSAECLQEEKERRRGKGEGRRGRERKGMVNIYNSPFELRIFCYAA